MHELGVLLREIVQLRSAYVENLSVEICLQDAGMTMTHERQDQHLPEQG